MGWANAPEITGVALPEGETYYEGDEFAAEGIVITYLGTDGQPTQVTVSAENLSSVQFLDSNGGALSGTLNAGTVNITVVYGGVYYEWSISVEKVVQTDIAVDTSAVKTVFGLNTAFTYDGLVVSAVYNNGDELVLVDGYQVSCEDADLATTGTKTVTVTSGEFETTYNIEVVKYLAELNNEYDSALPNSTVFNYYTAGIAVNGGKLSTDPDAPVGGIGYMDDQPGDNIKYKFSTAESGEFDIVLKLAGNRYAEGGANLGIDDISKVMTWKIDGEEVTVSAIGLYGIEERVWWNLQKIVITDIELAAGEHVIEIVNTPQLSEGTPFPNVGDMTIYSTTQVTPAVTAFIDDEYTNKGDYQYVMDATTANVTWSEGVATEAASVGGEYSRFGYFDSKGKWVNYQFATTATDTFDLCWIIAGFGGTDGIAKLSDVIKFTIDGVEVDLDDVTNLNSDTANYNYWQTHKIVINGVVLEAGTHNIRVEFISEETGYGVNIENLTLNYSNDLLHAEKLESFDSNKANNIVLNSDDVAGGSVLLHDNNPNDDQHIAATDEYTGGGGIGGFDKIGNRIEYYFNLAQAGTVDFNWSIAGVHWVVTDNSNAGLDKLEGVIKLTIDGMEIDLSRVTDLKPSGGGWWDLVSVVIQNMYLEAGNHTIVAEVMTDGSGANVAGMTISSDSSLTKGHVTEVTEAV